GLLSNSRRLDVIGNNIANVNTTAFKSNRMAFAPTFSRNFSLGTAPGSSTGGSNPGQVGLGVSVSGTQRNFANGAIGATGVNTDMAIEGAGFFIVEGAGERYYTRDGSFVRNPSNDLVTQNGARVLGFDVDEQFNVIEGNLVPLNIPVGTLTLAESTQEVIFNGNLNASGDVGAQGSQHRSRAFFTDAGGTVPVTGNEDLASDLWVSDGLGGTSLAFDSSSGGPIEITISGIEKGGKDLGTHTFTYGVDGTTLNDFTGWLDEVLGLDSTNIGGESLGGSVSFNASGQLVINGNEGTVQGFDIDSADIVVTGNTGAAGGLGQPFIMSQTQEPIGESVRTSFVVYDSLGTPVTVDLSFVLQDTNSSGGTVWEFVAETNDNAIDDRLIGLGVVEFDANGRYVSSTNQSFQIVRDNGAVTPLTVSMNFDSGTDSVSALTDTVSNLAAVYQDGSPIGTLSNFSIGEDGVISGAFTNGLTRSIGQVALAKFANPEGLVDAGNNLFTSGPNSGTPLIADPLEFGTGRVVGGALELSNVDLSQEFINMILASTGYSAASRVITTTDELINQLLVLGR
ncbi:MAG: flagellar hook-basal body complex protein, partial [Planctomycetota bacterium]|nr:flagellar hook-basal body complex protein [Planctomycetota bacterium]